WGLEARDWGQGAKGTRGQGESSSILFKSPHLPIPPSSSPSTHDTVPSSEHRPSSSIRVNVGLLDRVMNLVGELVLARNSLLQFANT
ncbi:MAG TPA: hypothetical protein DEV81_13615, partial [Cyanobacteria bacterium UBA11049]|nr:hypothetical protein [Cyanobacteria bacterium UBA11049]